jgi:predicted ATPase with chaperone activity
VRRGGWQVTFHEVLTPARTITDLAGAEQISPPHLAGAIQHRARVGGKG